MERKRPEAKEIYRHFKGNRYEIVTTAEDTETGEQLVIYRALYGEGRTWARELSNFMEELDPAKYPNASQKYRFEKEEAEQTAPSPKENFGSGYTRGTPIDGSRKNSPRGCSDRRRIRRF
jgi:hypothetical protein